MAEGLTFGNLFAEDRKLISTSRNIFEVMQLGMDLESRSSTDSQKKNSTERFEGRELETLSSINSNAKKSLENKYSVKSLPVHIEPRILMRNLTDDNSSCRMLPLKQNENNSAGSEKDLSTAAGENNSEVFRIDNSQSDTYLSVADSQENLNSTSIQTTSSLTELTRPQRINSKKRKIDEFFPRDEDISEFEQNINTQKYRETMGKDNSTQTSPVKRIISSQKPTSTRVSNLFYTNSPANSGNSTTDNSIEAHRIKNLRVIKGLEEEIDQAINRIRISDSTNFLDLTMTPDSSPQRITVSIYPPALGVWKQLRSLQTRKIILEVQTEFYKKLRQEEGYPDWAVMFNPPHNLLQTERVIESTVGFRATMAKQNLQMLEDLFCEENSRISTEINASMASLKVHYDTIESAEYDLEQATEVLNKFMLRAQQQEYNSLFKKYNSIMLAPRAALWKNMFAHIRPPPDAILLRSQGAQPGTSSRMNNSTTRINNSVPTSFGQNFQGPVRRDWQPSWGQRGRGGGRGGRGRGQGRIQKYNSTNQKDPKRTLCQMMDFLFDQF